MSGSNRVLMASLLVACVGVGWGCNEQHVRDFDADPPVDGGDGDADGDSDGDGDGDVTVNSVDILFIVDNSNSMAEEQETLAAQISVLVEELLSPSPDPISGTVPPAVHDLHIGVVSTDLGSGGFVVMTCDEPAAGDDGELQNAGHGRGCDDEYEAGDCPTGSGCPWLSHSEEHPDDGTRPDNPPIWEDFGCVSMLGTGGCGFEQPLEASLLALTERAAPGQPNEGFLREDSLLAIVYVTDEDDCSVADPALFDQDQVELGHLNVRCVLQPDLLHPLSRYHDAFMALRPGRPSLVLMAALTGVPIDGSWSPGDPIEILREMQRVNPIVPHEVLPSCDTPRGFAYPPVRFAELAELFGDNGLLGSICSDDYSALYSALAERIQARLE